jgi:hypothetical protein
MLPSTDKLDIVQGQGYRVSVKGNQLTDAPWNNMSCQGFQVCTKRAAINFF